MVLWMSLMTSMTFAQQLPDPHFEDWSGEKFNGEAQPKYWNFSNVDQVGQKFSFAHKGTGRSGGSLKIQDQFVGVDIGVTSIGATSPGYVALGHPWAYVASVTAINGATAGTYGGISWKYRPDSMVVWVKRYYDSSVMEAAGDHIKDEHFHLLYYAWKGTSKGASYRAKDLSCTDLSTAAPTYCVDEESDIRQGTNGNECGTKEFATQVAEGWFYQKKAYANWTRIVVPIYYLNDETPQKCNVILSAGRYPDFRANSGQYAGSTLEVDDIELIYSSKIQKLFVGGREWKGFDPNSSAEQVCSLGADATEIPELTPYRGVGSLTNTRGGTTAFPGRRLNSSECSITYGEVDGEPTVITVKSEDGKSTTTYRIKFVSVVSNNARLSDIKVNGQTISGFNAYLTTYNVALPYGTTETPVVEATTQDATAKMTITQPTSVNGTATIAVIASDGTTKQTYTLNFSVAALSDATLQNIYLDGAPLPGFQPNKSNYTVSLPLGTTTAPVVTWESAYKEGAQKVELLNNSLVEGAQIKVSIPGGTATKTYKITYKIEASSYSYLAGIFLDGEPLEGFEPEKTAYTITLPLGTTTLPVITWTEGDKYQEIQKTEGGVDGVTRIEVKAASGATTTYRLTFQTEKSTNNALAGIAINGEDLEGFDPDILTYTVTLPAGTTALPEVSFTQGDAYQKVTKTINTALMTVRLTVAAGDGSTRVYLLSFEIEKSVNALLQMIYLNGKALDGFVPEQLNYSLVWQEATMPKVTVLANEGQSVAISAPASYGTVQIIVTPEEGTPNTYTVTLISPDAVSIPAFPDDMFPASTNANLAALYIDGAKYEAFNEETLTYTYDLAWRTYQVPAILPVAGDKGQTITIEHGAVNRPTFIHVMAADKTTSKTYTIQFNVPKSGNTSLASVDLDGVDNFTFDPNTYNYTGLMLPYGTTETPTIMAERAEPEQSLLITEAPIGTPSTIVVTAEDGTTVTYSFSYQLAYPEKENILLGIAIDGVGELDMSQGPDFAVDLPFGSQILDIVSLTKNYPEQEVVVNNGGAYSTTTITVKSLNPNEADAVYTITPTVYPYDPAMLTDLAIDGATVPHFQPDVYNYVVSVPETPVVTFKAQTGAETDNNMNDKADTIYVESGEYSHKYILTFYYPNDVTFELDFENWADATNDDANETGKHPVGWNAPVTAITSGSKGSYHPADAVQFVTSPRTHGSKAVELATTYLLTAAEAMPGFICLSQPTVAVGYWALGLHDPTTFSYGSPITFRNTPDQVQLDYNYKEHANKANGWRFIYDANGKKQVSYSQAYSKLTAGTWYTLTRNLTYAEGYIPSTLEIIISSAPDDNPDTYYTNFGVSRSSSKMYVDNLRLNYSSVLNGLRVNGGDATMSGTAFAATIDADYYGMPELAFSHAVSDQMPVIAWSEETDGVRTATIRNYAENVSSYTDYTLTVTRPKSTKTNCTYSLNGRDLNVSKATPYQTIAVTTNDTAYVITVTAENGDQKTYYAAWNVAGEGTSEVTTVPAQDPITGVSTARLVNIEEEPILTYEREYALDSVFMVTTDTCYELHVFGTAGDTTYVIRRYPSKNALLASMETNNVSVPGFYEESYSYVVSLESLDAFSATAQDPDADVQYVVVPIDAANSVVYVLVTAADGTTKARYSVLVQLHTLGTCADLVSITADDASLSGFQTSKTDYTIDLPAGSTIPQLASVACEGATVESNTQMVGTSAIVTYTVTSEDANATQTYTVHVNVALSEVCSLADLFVEGETVEAFASDRIDYAIELPYGTTELPEINYVLTDKRSTANKTTEGMVVTITVTAEDGSHSTVYTITFTIAKSTNANLASIALDGETLPAFFADVTEYTVTLPYGAVIPTITAESEDPNATVVVNEDHTITVTAEDGVSTQTYTLTFSFLPSTNAQLLSIDLNDEQVEGFEADEFDYTITLAYGTPLPDITWLVGDEQQQVDTTWTDETHLVITVTAGDGTTSEEYTLTFVFQLSSNWYLSDLQVRGTTVTGFRKDSLAYELIYPVGTKHDALCTSADITAIPEDANATVNVSMDEDLVKIVVTAQDGTLGVYTIDQIILLSSEARLRMIWMDDTTEVRDFNPDTLAYTITLTQGSVLPIITAATIDPSATWDLGMETELEDGGKQVEIYGEAEDGTIVTYRLTFRYANWNASSIVDADDYLFFYIGDGQYKAVTIGIGIQLAIYDMSGHRLVMENLPVADPSDVYVELEMSGNQRLMKASPNAAGYIFKPLPGQAYFYVFYDSKTKKIAKGGKFMMSVF